MNDIDSFRKRKWVKDSQSRGLMPQVRAIAQACRRSKCGRPKRSGWCRSDVREGRIVNQRCEGVSEVAEVQGSVHAVVGQTIVANGSFRS